MAYNSNPPYIYGYGSPGIPNNNQPPPPIPPRPTDSTNQAPPSGYPYQQPPHYYPPPPHAPPPTGQYQQYQQYQYVPPPGQPYPAYPSPPAPGPTGYQPYTPMPGGHQFRNPPPPPPRPHSGAPPPSTYPSASHTPTPSGSVPGQSSTYPGSQSVPAQDPTVGINAQFSGLNLDPNASVPRGAPGTCPGASNASPGSTTPSNAPHATARPAQPPRPFPTYRRTGPNNKVIVSCPEDEAVEYPLTWYHHVKTPNFLICSYCHDKYIARSLFADVFTAVECSGGPDDRCRFYLPRLCDALWPAAVTAGDLSKVKAYMANRLNVPGCLGPSGAPAEKRVKWFKTVDGSLQHFGACEACFEDRIKDTAFESRFAPSPLQQRSGETWACDACLGHIARAFTTFGMKGRNDWPAFVQAAERRLNGAPCSGQPETYNPGGKARWYTTRPGRQSSNPDTAMTICETCYLDKIALTEFDHEFTPWRPMVGAGGAQCQCDMTTPSMIVALASALMYHNFEIFWSAADIILSSPPCTTEGHKGSKWYTLKGGCQNFDLCQGCHAGFITSSGLAPFFEPVHHDPTNSIVCDFHPAQPRFLVFMKCLSQALTVGVFAPFETYVRRHANVPPCQKSTMLVNATWYGFADAPSCSDCYAAVVAGSALDSKLQMRGVSDPRSTMCCLYSPRMRRAWAEACAEGSPDGFIAVAQHRMQVYNATMPQVEALEKMRLIRIKQAQHQGLLSVQYKGMAGMKELSGISDSYATRYDGQSYATAEAATSARLFDSMQAGMSNANNPQDLMKIVQLRAQWRMVE